MKKPGKCATCAYWDIEFREKPEFGWCVYNPPTVVVIDNDSATVQPSTHHTFWCGKYSKYNA